MSLWIKVAVGVLVLAVLAVALALRFTAGMTHTADGFFQAVGQKDMARAHAFLSEGFRRSVGEHALDAFLENNAIAGFKEAHWSSRKVENGRGSLSGSIINDTGGVVPISVDLVRENGDWKIYAIRKQRAGMPMEEPPALETPGGAVVRALIQASMRDFAVSVQQQDMSHFRSTLAQRWQKQVSVEELNRIFAPFHGQGMNLLKLAATEPVPTASPRVTTDRALVVEGYYPVGAKHVLFTQTYDLENGVWKLIRFNLEIADAPASARSSDGA